MKNTQIHTTIDNRTLKTNNLSHAVTRQAAKTRSKLGRAAVGLSVALLLLTAGTTLGQTKTWVGNGAQAFNQGIWGGNANWSPSGPANGADNTAYFTNTFNNGFVCIVNTARIIGNIWFTHPANTTDFTLLRHASDFTLTLAVSTGFPVVNITQGERTLTIDAVTAGTNGLAKNGAGTLTFTRPNTYTGTTVVNAGTLKSRTGSATTGVTVAGGATSIVVLDPNFPQLAIAGGWTNANDSALGIDYAGTTPSTSTPPIQVDNFALGSNLTCRISADLFTALSAGQSYPLINWTGSGPTDASAFTNLVLASLVTGNLSVTGNTLFLNITTNNWGPLSWNTGNGNWDTTTANWLNAALSPATYNNTPGDAVLFDDAPGATGNPTVTLATVLSPTGVTMNSTNHDYTLSGIGGIRGVNGLTLGAGNLRTLTLLATTNHTYSGGITINAGKLRLGAANVIPDGAGKGTVTVNTNGTLDLNGFSEVINNLLGSGVVDNGGGGSATLTIGSDNSTTTFFGILQNTAGTLNLVKNGTGLLSLSGANTLTGTVTMNGGTLSFDNPVALATVTNLTLAGGTILNPSADNSVINGSITLGASNTTSLIYGVRPFTGAGTPYYLILNGPIVGAGNVTFSSANQSATAPTIILNAQSTYTGSTLITCDANASAGLNCYVRLGTNNGLPTTTVLSFDGLDNSANRYVQLELNGFDQTLAGLANVPRGRQQVVGNNGSPATLTLNTASNFTFTGTLGISGDDSFGLTKNGAGKQVLGGANTYTGPTIINQGILELGTGGQLGAGYYYESISIAGGAALLFTSTNTSTLGGVISGGGSLTNAGRGTLTLAGANTFTGTTVVSSGATLGFTGGSLSGPLTVTDGGSVSLSGAGTVAKLVFANTGAMSFDVSAGGNLTVTAAHGITNNGGAGSITMNLTGNAPGDGTYTLIAYSGSLQGSGYSAYQLGTAPAGKTYQLIDTGSAVQLAVTPALIWTGAQSSEWSLNPIAGSKNWTYNASPADFTNGISVVFDDTVGSGSTTPDLSVADVMPARVAFENSAYPYTLQGSQAIAGAASLTKNGFAKLTILNNNPYSGPTAINEGIVQIGNGSTSGALGSGAITDNSTLQFNRGDALAVANSISGMGTLEQNGNGTLTLAGANTYTGATTVNAGTLNLTGTNAGSSITVNNGAVFNEAPTGVIAGTGTFTHASTGTSTLAGSNTFTGAITVSAGELDLSRWSTNTLGAVTVAGTPGAILGISGNATYNLGANSLFGGTATGSSGTVNQTAGTVTFTSGNAVLLGNGAGSGSSGTYNLSGGTLTTGFTNTTRGVILGVNTGCSGTFNLSGTGNLGITNGNLQIGRSDAAAGSSVCLFNQTGGTATVGTLTLGGNLATSGTNTATLSLTAGTFTANSFTRLALGNDDVVAITIGGTARVTLPAFPTARGTNASATITFDSTSGFLSPLAASTAYLPAGSFANHAYLTTNGANFNAGQNITIGQGFEDAPGQAGKLTKTGTATLTLSGTNTYIGATTVSNGTLLVNGAISSPVTVIAGATLGGSGNIGGSVALNGTVSPGTSVGTLTTGSQTWNGGATNRFELSSATNSAVSDLLNINGTLNVQATAGNKFTVKLVSMTNATTAGLVPDFKGNSNYTWTVATASGGVLNFDASKFAIDTSAFSNAFTDTFSVAVQGNSLVVNYGAPLAPPTLVSYGPWSGGSLPLTFSGPNGQTYKVLSSTNVALPLASWTVLSSGAFGASPVTYTDTSATNANQFYRIQSP
jgi:autotransporter-associated beta strand protein